jgi:hypothetical protein
MPRQADEMSQAKDFYDFVGNSGHHWSDNFAPLSEIVFCLIISSL